LKIPFSISYSPIIKISGIPLSKAYEKVLSVLGLSTYKVSAFMPFFHNREHVSILLAVKFFPKEDTRI
jgi:hypothetical protein